MSLLKTLLKTAANWASFSKLLKKANKMLFKPKSSTCFYPTLQVYVCILQRFFANPSPNIKFAAITC